MGISLCAPALPLLWISQITLLLGTYSHGKTHRLEIDFNDNLIDGK
jgi:hypothetical protein